MRVKAEDKILISKISYLLVTDFQGTSLSFNPDDFQYDLISTHLIEIENPRIRSDTSRVILGSSK